MTLSKITTAFEKFDYYIKNANLDAKDYQYDGVKWILDKELRKNPLEGVRGGIIADEMGLGKTIMMIGTIVSNFVRNTLIVVPFTL